MCRIYLVILSVALFAIGIHAYPDGAPKKACTRSMLPKHHKITPQPPSTSPLTKFNATWNADNETISVTIESKEPIKGIFIQGRQINGTEPVGTFTNLPTGTHLVNCPSGDGVTHSSPQKWTQFEVTWKKPLSIRSQETIQFWATIVVNFKTFWVVKNIE